MVEDIANPHSLSAQIKTEDFHSIMMCSKISAMEVVDRLSRGLRGRILSRSELLSLASLTSTKADLADVIVGWINDFEKRGGWKGINIGGLVDALYAEILDSRPSNDERMHLAESIAQGLFQNSKKYVSEILSLYQNLKYSEIASWPLCV